MIGPAGTTRERAAAVTLAAALMALALWAAMQPWGLRWDFANFYDTGQRIRAGEARNIYESTSPIAGEPPLGVMRFWGPPIAGLLYVPMAMLPPRTALAIFKLQNVAVYAAALTLFAIAYLKPLDLHTPTSPARKLFAFLVLCAVFQPFWTVFLVGGQTTPTILLLLIGFVLSFSAGRDALAAAFLVAVFTIKPAFIVMVVALAIARQVRLLLFTTVWGACAAGASLALYGWPLHVVFLDRMLRGLEEPRLWQYNSSLVAFVDNFRLAWEDGHPPAYVERALSIVAVALRLGIIALVAYAWTVGSRGATDDRGRRHFAALLAVLFFLLFSEIVWEHYVMVLFIPAMFVLVREPRFPRGAVRLALVALMLCAFQNIFFTLTLNSFVDIDTVPEVLLIGALKSGPVILMALLLARYPGELATAYPSTESAGPQ